MRLEAMAKNGARIVITDKSDSRNIQLLNQVMEESKEVLELKEV